MIYAIVITGIVIAAIFLIYQILVWIGLDIKIKVKWRKKQWLVLYTEREWFNRAKQQYAETVNRMLIEQNPKPTEQECKDQIIHNAKYNEKVEFWQILLITKYR